MTSLSKEAALVHAALEERGLETPLRVEVLDRETRKRRIKAHDRNHAAAESRSVRRQPGGDAASHRQNVCRRIFSGLDYANFRKSPSSRTK